MKIIATIGDGSAGVDTMRTVIDAGAHILRFNLAAGCDTGEVIQRVTRAACLRALGVEVMFDFPIPGRKLRMGTVGRQAFSIRIGDLLDITRSPDWPAHAREVFLAFDRLDPRLAVGDELTVGDGELTLQVVDVPALSRIVTRSLSDWFLSDGKSVHVAGRCSIDTDDYEARMLALVDAVGFLQPEYCCFSFVENAEQLLRIRSLLRRHGPRGWSPRIVAKIESYEAMTNLKSIVAEADMVMVARGDLAIQLPYEQLGLHQNRIIRTAVESSTPVILATQLLESAMTRRIPNRSEVADLTNALLSGISGVVLAKETSMAGNPAYPVVVARRVIAAVEEDQG